MIVVYGLGCNVFKNSMAVRQKALNAARNKNLIAGIETYCNTDDPKSMVRNIANATFRKKMLVTPFVERVMQRVCEALQQGEKVILIGHSYGGSVVSRIAMHLRCKEYAQHLRAVTFGSIFVPPMQLTKGVNIQHYSYKNDVAIACHRSKNIEYWNQPHMHGPVNAHMQYNKYILEIAKSGSVNFTAPKFQKIKQTLDKKYNALITNIARQGTLKFLGAIDGLVQIINNNGTYKFTFRRQ